LTPHWSSECFSLFNVLPSPWSGDLGDQSLRRAGGLQAVLFIFRR